VNKLRIGTRGSALALWQARTVAGLLEAGGTPVEIVVIRTAGDERPRGEEASRPAAVGTVALKRLFVKEIEDALLREEIDIAVHSAKDMSVELPDGLAIAAVLPREDPRDALVLPAAANASLGVGGRERQPHESTSVRPGSSVDDIDAVLAHLGRAPVIGTSSVRRSAQLAALLPQATFAPIRGNVDTRLRKLDEGHCMGLVLAAAGMIRLGMHARISASLPIDRCVPAPGQGIVAIEIRTDDRRARGALETINDRSAATSLTAERAVVSALGGGCQLPLGAIALHDNGHLELHAVVASPDGQRIIRRFARGTADDPEGLGAMLAGELASAGAGRILDEVRGSQET
jgi:hydroxymethylbilane synthase